MKHTPIRTMIASKLGLLVVIAAFSVPVAITSGSASAGTFVTYNRCQSAELDGNPYILPEKRTFRVCGSETYDSVTKKYRSVCSVSWVSDTDTGRVSLILDTEGSGASGSKYAYSSSGSTSVAANGKYQSCKVNFKASTYKKFSR